MGSADRGVGGPRERIEGVRVPCWDAKRRVWKAIELLERERGTTGWASLARPKVETRPEASTGR
jgi:hypothetical protein